MEIRLRAEWEKQRAILMAFPHKNTHWCSILDEARENFINIIKAILPHQKVILCVDPRDDSGIEQIKDMENLEIYKIKTNDTWARDFGPITIQHMDGKATNNILLDFGFNGWGLKFASDFDNQISRELSLLGAFGRESFKSVDMILEGGSIDTNGEGVLLTNTQCLLEANRNPSLSQEQIESRLKKLFGLKRVVWLNHGYLAGDDTDSHIDTLARFIAPNKIAYVGVDDVNDEHFNELKLMENELKALDFDLVKLPFTRPIFDESNERLPSSYANFLFINGAILVPTYNDKNDDLALEIFAKEFPDRKIVGIDCSTLIKQHGSLHCVSMQIY